MSFWTYFVTWIAPNLDSLIALYILYLHNCLIQNSVAKTFRACQTCKSHQCQLYGSSWQRVSNSDGTASDRGNTTGGSLKDALHLDASRRRREVIHLHVYQTHPVDERLTVIARLDAWGDWRYYIVGLNSWWRWIPHPIGTLMA